MTLFWIIVGLVVALFFAIGIALAGWSQRKADKKTIAALNSQLGELKEKIAALVEAMEKDKELEILGQKIDSAIEEATDAKSISDIRYGLARRIGGLLS